MKSTRMSTASQSMIRNSLMSGWKHCPDVLKTVEHPRLTGSRSGPHEPIFSGGGLGVSILRTALFTSRCRLRLHEGRRNSDIEHLLSYHRLVVADELRQNLVDLSHVGSGSDLLHELALDGAERGFYI